METPKIVLDCGHPPTVKPDKAITVGYAIHEGGRKVCYACAAARTRADMVASGRATLYLVLRSVPVAPSDTDGRPLEETAAMRANPAATVARWFVTDWPGELEFKCFPGVRRSPRGGGFGSERIDAWFPGPDGFIWHAINRGDMQIARCRRTRERVSYPVATLTPVRMEVARARKGRPGFVWVDGYKVTDPDGRELAPYMRKRKREALAFCKAQGWRAKVLP